jgi:hypothetical protein
MFSRSFIRLSTLAAGSAALTTIYTRKSVLSDFAAPFDNQGFPIESIPLNVSKKAQPLYLLGVGMRRKNLYIVEVDIYKVGFCLSAEALKKGKEAIISGQKISDLVLEESKSSSADYIPALSVPLIFVRSVSTNMVVDAFNDAFAGCDPAAVTQFKTVLRDSIGAGGMNVGDEITYYWLKGGGIVIAKNGVAGGMMRNKEIEKRLLDVYVDPSRTVSPDLVKSIQSHIHDLNTK